MAKKRSGYEVGYGKPPSKNRFKKGQSGNPRGRPRARQHPAKVVAEELSRLVSINENGQSYKISKFHAIIKQVTRQAMMGMPRAQKLIMDLLPYVEAELATDPSRVSDSFEEFVALLNQSAARRAPKFEPSEDK
jgi:hypothetical protein